MDMLDVQDMRPQGSKLRCHERETNDRPSAQPDRSGPHLYRSSPHEPTPTADLVRGDRGCVAHRNLCPQQGLTVAKDSQQIAQTTAQHTGELLQQTSAMLTTVKQVVAALGPLQQLQGKINDVVSGVQAGVALARSTLALAQQTLSTGKQALQIALITLDTLRQSRTLQQQLLDIARQTLQQTQEINKKIPGAPIFPAAATSAGP